MKSPDIVVGVDGSAPSDRAVRWAAAAAVRHDVDLVVRHVYDGPAYGTAGPLGAPYLPDLRVIAEAIVDRAITAARAAAPGVTVRGETLLGGPGPTLVAESCNGATVVLGHRGRGGFASLLRGSVSQQVVLHATGSVVVVRGRPDPTGPVMVGVDGSPGAHEALGVALQEAAGLNAGVVAVRIYPPPDLIWSTAAPAYLEDAKERRHRELEALTAGVAEWRDKFPDVEVDCVAVQGRPAAVLVGVSATAQLVVVGNRGHGGLAGTLLGSVGLQLIQHAGCPILIARGGQA